jgi:hypothetical protein
MPCSQCGTEASHSLPFTSGRVYTELSLEAWLQPTQEGMDLGSFILFRHHKGKERGMHARRGMKPSLLHVGRGAMELCSSWARPTIRTKAGGLWRPLFWGLGAAAAPTATATKVAFPSHAEPASLLLVGWVAAGHSRLGTCFRIYWGEDC